MTASPVTYEGWVAAEIAMPPGITEEDERFDILQGALFDLGAAGLEVKDADGGLRVSAAFPPEHAGDGPSLLDALGDALELSAIEGAQIELDRYLPIDWATHWREHFHPIRFGSSDDPSRALWVVPTWLEPPKGAAHVLRMDPSSAFGTGLHATTALCLESLIAASPIDSVLDIGTGSGILALAALELGARRAVATDNDPEALRVAEENAIRNNLSERLVLSAEDPSALAGEFDLVVANILARPLIDLAPEIASKVRQGGRVVLSGITPIQAEDVVRAYAALGLTAPVVTVRDEWARVVLEALR